MRSAFLTPERATSEVLSPPRSSAAPSPRNEPFGSCCCPSGLRRQLTLMWQHRSWHCKLFFAVVAVRRVTEPPANELIHWGGNRKWGVYRSRRRLHALLCSRCGSWPRIAPSRPCPVGRRTQMELRTNHREPRPGGNNGEGAEPGRAAAKTFLLDELTQIPNVITLSPTWMGLATNAAPIVCRAKQTKAGKLQKRCKAREKKNWAAFRLQANLSRIRFLLKSSFGLAALALNGPLGTI